MLSLRLSEQSACAVQEANAACQLSDVSVLEKIGKDKKKEGKGSGGRHTSAAHSPTPKDIGKEKGLENSVCVWPVLLLARQLSFVPKIESIG